MNWRKHFCAAAGALLVFLILTVASGTLGEAAMIAMAALSVAATIGYQHYRKRDGRKALDPVTPGRDDRIIPQDVKVAVSVRDKGKCRIRGPGCLVDREIQFDHVYPWSLGGSSKDEDNIQLACSVCNRRKSNKVPSAA